MKLALLCAAVVAGANPSAVAAADYLDTIVVTASRTPQSLASANSAMTVISREEIERSGLGFVADLLRRVPGVAVTSNGGIGKKTEIRMRGAESNHVLVLIDGVEANDLSTVDEFEFGNLVTDNIERIEIVRGPHSSLWGSEAVAGVINIITRGPEERFSADFSLEGGSFATSRIAAGAGGGGDNYGVRFAVNRLDSGGTNVSRRGGEDDAYHQHTLDFKGHVDLNEFLQLTTSLRQTSAEGQTDSFDFVTSLPFDTPGTSDTSQTYAQAGLTAALWDGRWIQKLAGRWTSTSNEAVDPVAFLDSDLSGDKYALNYQSSWSFDAPLAIAETHRLTLAIDHEHEDYADHAFERHLDVTGYVLEYSARWFALLDLSGSVRYDRNSDFKDVVTYRVAGGHDLPLTLGRLTLAYATGQKAPLFTERFGFSPSIFFTFVGNAALKPEQSTGWEVNFQRRFARVATLLDVTYFNERTEDEINGFFPAGLGVFTAINLPGITRRRGVEAELRANLGASCELNASYTHVAATDVLDGPRLDKVRVPRHQGALGGVYRFAGERARVGLDLNVSGTRDDFDFSTIPRRRVGLEARTLLNLHGAYDVTPRVRVSAHVDNLLDDRDAEVLGFLQPGIAGYLGLRISSAQ